MEALPSKRIQHPRLNPNGRGSAGILPDMVCRPARIAGIVRTSSDIELVAGHSLLFMKIGTPPTP